MKPASNDLHTADSLRQLVRQRLCEPDYLDPDRYELTESPLLRRGQRCGMLYCLHGPRAVRLTAIWSADEQMLYCYDSRGERFLTTPARLDPTPGTQAA